MVELTVSFTTELVSIMLRYFINHVPVVYEISVIAAVLFSKLRDAMLFCKGYQAFVVT